VLHNLKIIYTVNLNVGDLHVFFYKYRYDDNIIERKDKQSMKGLQLVGFKESHLHSV
jgi:hypothetical protein